METNLFRLVSKNSKRNGELNIWKYLSKRLKKVIIFLKVNGISTQLLISSPKSDLKIKKSLHLYSKSAIQLLSNLISTVFSSERFCFHKERSTVTMTLG